MNKADLVAAVRSFHGGVSRAEARSIVDAVFRGAGDLLVEEGGFRVPRFGVVEVRRRRGRRGADPRTGRAFVSARRRAPFFRPSRALLEGLSAGSPEGSSGESGQGLEEPLESRPDREAVRR